jgi:geranylgeranyl pyrophosphate synthase
MLVCLVCESLGGNIDNAVKRAVGIECIHASTLVHDDLIDGDKFRRSKPAVWTLEGVGPKGAILLGDFLYASGMNIVSQIGREDIEIVSEAMGNLVSGALLELTSGPQRDSYEETISLKTGALFGASAKIGAVAAGASGFYEDAYIFGLRCGEAFQIADDLKDLEAERDFPNEKFLDERILLVVESINSFPQNVYTEMLKQVPAYIVDAMMGETK